MTRKSNRYKRSEKSLKDQEIQQKPEFEPVEYVTPEVKDSLLRIDIEDAAIDAFVKFRGFIEKNGYPLLDRLNIFDLFEFIVRATGTNPDIILC